MDNNAREKFWNVLNELHDSSEVSVRMLMDASPWPKTLCRFRSISEHSLEQLQENKLFFSSADHYDDPFDTYFYIDVDQMVPTYEEIRKDLLEGNKELADKLHQIAIFTGLKPDTFVKMLTKGTLDFTELKGQLIEVRNSIQKRLFLSKIIIGLRTPQYERRLIVSAAKIAGIQEIHELCINDSDELDSKPVSV